MRNDETEEQQLMRVLSEMVDSGEVKTIMVHGELSYYIEKPHNEDSQPKPHPQLEELIRNEDVIKIFREGDVIIGDRYAKPSSKHTHSSTLEAYNLKKEKLTRRFNALL
jgi:hypothetical protein